MTTKTLSTKAACSAVFGLAVVVLVCMLQLSALACPQICDDCDCGSIGCTCSTQACGCACGSCASYDTCKATSPCTAKVACSCGGYGCSCSSHCPQLGNPCGGTTTKSCECGGSGCTHADTCADKTFCTPAAPATYKPCNGTEPCTCVAADKPCATGACPEYCKALAGCPASGCELDTCADDGCQGKGCASASPACEDFCALDPEQTCGGTCACSDQTNGCRKKGPDYKGCVDQLCGSADCRQAICKNYTPPCDNGTWCCGGCANGMTYSGCPSYVHADGYGHNLGCETAGVPPYAHCRDGSCSCTTSVVSEDHCGCDATCTRCHGTKCTEWCSYHVGTCGNDQFICKGTGHVQPGGD